MGNVSLDLKSKKCILKHASWQVARKKNDQVKVELWEGR